MNDILQKLKSVGTQEWVDANYSIIELCQAAAEEIERLRAALKRIGDGDLDEDEQRFARLTLNEPADDRSRRGSMEAMRKLRSDIERQS